MYQRTSNAIQRARNSTGLTQEALAERSGYSSDSVRAWESGARVPSLEALNILAESLAAPWLPGVFLREQSAYLNSLIPDFRPGLPVAEAAAPTIGPTSGPPVNRNASNRSAHCARMSVSSVSGNMTGVPPARIIASIYPGSIHRLSRP